MLGLITAGGTGFILYFSEGLKALDTIDYWVNNLLMVSLATITIIIFGWIIGSRDGVQMANQGAVIRLPRGLSFVIRFITPLFLLCVLGTWVLEDIVGIRISSPELTGENPYVRDLFIEPNLVAWMSVTMIAMVICFVILNLLPASRFYRRMDESEHSPRRLNHELCWLDYFHACRGHHDRPVSLVHH